LTQTCEEKVGRRRVRAMSLIEVIVAMAIVSIVFVLLVEQFRTSRISWASKRANTEVIQNGRALMNHITFHLMKARRVTAVSDPCDSNGFIEFSDHDGGIMRYQIGENNYVQYGLTSDLSDLAGPVTALYFTCYDSCDLDTSISDVDYIRSIKVQATLPNPNILGRNHTLTTLAYLRTNYMSERIILGAEYKFESSYCHTPALSKIDDQHFLCAYDGPSNDGWAVVLMPKRISDDWQISKGTPFEFDSSEGRVPELCQIDMTHYLCAYRGQNSDGWAVVLTVNPGTWKISKDTAFEFAPDTGLPIPEDPSGDSDTFFRPALARINGSHYLCAYMGQGFDGWAVVLMVNPSANGISLAGTALEFDNVEGRAPALAQIDYTHYLCAYTGPDEDGWAVVLTIEPGSWTITKETPFEFAQVRGYKPDLAKIDDTHYLCAYSGPDEDGWAVVLNVDLATWQISKNTSFEFDPVRGEVPELQRVDLTNYVCSYEGECVDPEYGDLADSAASIILSIRLGNWTVFTDTPISKYSYEGDAPDIAVIDSTHFISAYDGWLWKGWATVLGVDLAIKP
jgi:prepilin-type N-terminal cleavage/methylation domain-containing protein